MRDKKVLKFYAHTSNNNSVKTSWHPLREHLVKVAILCSDFSHECLPNDKRFSEIAYLAGLLHDLGKYRTEFQEYLEGLRPKSKETQHAIYGAAAAANKYRSPQATFAILGHHSGLPNKCDIKEKLQNISKEHLNQLLKRMEVEISDAQLDSLPVVELKTTNEILSLEFAIRLIFSCLVDADWLDTAEFMQGTSFEKRPLKADALLKSLKEYVKNISVSKTPDPLSRLRNKVFESAIAEGVRPPGFFTMTVPTGGGKTLSSMAFALRHAYLHGLNRIIVVIPYLSIIEQNADVYREIFGEEVLIEHHSAVSIPDDTEEQKHYTQMRLITENWDGAIIVTTSVQFIESLFAANPGRCRKLHNIARSVVIFDECQTLPTHLLEPTLNVFRELVRNYQTSFIFCSATQPGFKSTSIREGLQENEVHEIAPNPLSLFKTLQRVHYHIPPLEQRISWSELAHRIVKLPQALVVVNTRRQAYELHQSIQECIVDEEYSSLYHLSSAMTAQHRSDVLGNAHSLTTKSIRGRLIGGFPCRVVSTQLVEAGVDLDFPVVYRAIAPLDSIVQTAGRCNREGKLPQFGDVHVFIPDTEPIVPPGVYNIATQTTMEYLTTITPDEMVMDPGIFSRYFDQLYQRVNLDVVKLGEKTIQEMRQEFMYKSVAMNATVIDQDTQSIIVPYRDANQMLRMIRKKGFLTQADLRGLQRYMISVNSRDLTKLESLSGIDDLLPDIPIPVLAEGFYHETYGMLIDTRPLEDLIV